MRVKFLFELLVICILLSVIGIVCNADGQEAEMQLDSTSRKNTAGEVIYNSYIAPEYKTTGDELEEKELKQYSRKITKAIKAQMQEYMVFHFNTKIDVVSLYTVQIKIIFDSWKPQIRRIEVWFYSIQDVEHYTIKQEFEAQYLEPQEIAVIAEELFLELLQQI